MNSTYHLNLNRYTQKQRKVTKYSDIRKQQFDLKKEEESNMLLWLM
jgi:hypothetical protein